MNNGFSNISTPTLNGLVGINADIISTNAIATNAIATNAIVLNGVDVSLATLSQVPINTANITALQQITTGIPYNSSTDTTKIDNNVDINFDLYTAGNITSEFDINCIMVLYLHHILKILLAIAYIYLLIIVYMELNYYQ